MLLKRYLVLYLLITGIETSLYAVDSKDNLNTSIPVIFVHKNDPHYLEHTLYQAKQFNDRVILIGDASNSHYSHLGIEHYNIADYYTSASYFASLYTHLTSCSYEWGITVFQRWFILGEFIRKNSIPVALYIESDVMLYCNATEEYYKNYKDFDIALVNGEVGMISFWNLSSIQELNTFLIDFYNDKQTISMLAKQYDLSKSWTHIIDDIPLFPIFVKRYQSKLKICSLTQIIDQSTFDSSIFAPQWTGEIYRSYEMKTVRLKDGSKIEIKDIKFFDGYPVCYNKGLDMQIKFKALHFQASAKEVIAHYKIENSQKSQSQVLPSL